MFHFQSSFKHKMYLKIIENLCVIVNKNLSIIGEYHSLTITVIKQSNSAYYLPTSFKHFISITACNTSLI